MELWLIKLIDWNWGMTQSTLETTLEILCNTFQRKIVFEIVLNSALSHVNNEYPERWISSEIMIWNERFCDSATILTTILTPQAEILKTLFKCLRAKKWEFICLEILGTWKSQEFLEGFVVYQETQINF